MISLLNQIDFTFQYENSVNFEFKNVKNNPENSNFSFSCLIYMFVDTYIDQKKKKKNIIFHR